MLSTFVLSTLFLAENVSAHGRLVEPMTRVGHAGYENDPIGFQGRPMTNFACRHGYNPAVDPMTVTAGEGLFLEWHITANHVGDAGIYISYDYDLDEEHKHEMEFFKIANIPKTRDFKYEPYQIQIPDWLPAGRAVLRWEWYALHVNPTIELYVQCADIKIVSTPSALPLSDIQKYTVVTADGVPRTQFLYNTDLVLYRDGFNPGDDFVTGPECAFEERAHENNKCSETSPGTTGWVDLTGANPVPRPTTPPPATPSPVDNPAGTPSPVTPASSDFFFLDSSTDFNTRKTLANIGGLLAQCAWESGGDAPFHACDENNWSGSATASCTQRADGSLYHDLVGTGACDVDPNMQMTAVTAASWTTGPIECTPGTATEKCCWWGRGAIQTTGPFNYGHLQSEVVEHMGMIDDTTGQPMNLCTNPEAICQNDELKFVGSFYYWVSVVQENTCFDSMIDEYAMNWNNDVDAPGCARYSTGIGGAINNGNWNHHAHGEHGRQAQFSHMMSALQTGYNDYDGQLPTEICTGDDKIDRILEQAAMRTHSAVDAYGVYSWSGFCSTLRVFLDDGSNPPATPSPVDTTQPPATAAPVSSPVATPSPVDTTQPPVTPSPVTPATPSPVEPVDTTTTTPGTAPAPSPGGVIVDESRPDGAKCAGADYHEQPACASGLGCYAQNEWYSGCKPSCPAGWMCEEESADLGTAFPERSIGRKCAGQDLEFAGSCADGLTCFKRSWDSTPSSWSGCFNAAPTNDWIVDEPTD